MKTLQDYIKLAEEYLDEPYFGEKSREFRDQSLELGPQMAKALIEAEELLQEFYDYGYDRRKCEKALSQIQALNGGSE